ncbi:MAG: tetratricopeptide repeat protein, partial [Pseudomonadota bacterium]|nr:tetratricopeptide repeat protein [Pseudomonadota bacterium]
LDRDPDDTRFIMGRAVALQKMGQTSAAIRAYQRVIVVDPDNFVALTNLLGLIGRNSPRAALSELITLVDKYPDQDMIAAQIGFTYAELGDSENALKNLRWAAKLAPGNPTYQMNVAVLFDQKGNTTMAATHYRNTLKLAELGNDNDSLPIETIKARLNYLTGTR